MIGPDPNKVVREKAAEWFVRSQSSDFSPADWRSLHAWMAEDPAHADAFKEMEQVWVDLDDAPIEQPSAEVIPFRPKPTAKKPRKLPLWIAGAAAAAAATLAVFVSGVLRPPAPVQKPAEVAAYETRPGERREFTLKDGTHLALNGGTRLLVGLDGPQRRVAMAGGEAAFEVAHDKAHPFVIALGERQVTVVGTEFNILRAPAKLVVTVRQGIVAVASTDKEAKAVRLTAGRQLTHKTGEAGDTVRTVDPAAADGWRSGRLSYTGAPLSEVADDVGRYFGTKVEVDPDVRGLPFTGVLTLDEERAVLARLEMFLPIKAESGPSGVRLVRGVTR